MKWKSFFTEVYLINLPEMTERLKVSDESLKENGIYYTLVPAIKNEYGIQGLLDTMETLFTKILNETTHQNIIVLEDDFKFLLKPNGFLNLLVEQLPDDYDALFLGCNLLSRPERFSENLLRINNSYSTHAIGYSRKGIEKIMPLFRKPTAYDILLMKGLQPDGKCFATFPMLATQHAGYSSIEKKEIDWSRTMAETFAAHTKYI